MRQILRQPSTASLLGAVIAAAVIAAPAQAAATWRFTEGADGVRSATTWAQGQTPAGQVPMKLEVRCRPGPDGVASIVTSVRGAQGMPSFNFDDFLGPDAPAAKRKLGTIRVVALRRDVSVSTSMTGSYLEDGTFAFNLSAPLVGRNEVKWLTDAMILGAVLIVVTVQDPRDPRRRIQAQFQASNASVPVTNTMDGCVVAAAAGGIAAEHVRAR
ncbi:MAG: hypothetical protein IT515_17765 [Burkholderiales bacterium]|nr:hypothetical protein [Burkholderiales bacterium]